MIPDTEQWYLLRPNNMLQQNFDTKADKILCLQMEGLHYSVTTITNRLTTITFMRAFHCNVLNAQSPPKV
jgi:hypothetical protein